MRTREKEREVEKTYGSVVRNTCLREPFLSVSLLRRLSVYKRQSEDNDVLPPVTVYLLSSNFFVSILLRLFLMTTPSPPPSLFQGNKQIKTALPGAPCACSRFRNAVLRIERVCVRNLLIVSLTRQKFKKKHSSFG